MIFASYTHTTGTGQIIFGNSVIDADLPRTAGDISKLEEKLRKDLHYAPWGVTLLFWKEML